jgi:hypothetical protein
MKGVSRSLKRATKFKTSLKRATPRARVSHGAKETEDYSWPDSADAVLFAVLDLEETYC